MNTRLLLVGTLLVGSAAPTFAQTTANFTRNTEPCVTAPCPTYLTDTDEVTIANINVSASTVAYTSKVVASVNGVVYQGYAVYTVTTVIKNIFGNHEYIFHYDESPLLSTDGQVLLLSMDVDYKSILIRSGHNWYRHSYTVLSGTVTLP